MPYGPLLIVDDEPQNLAALHQVLSGKYPLVFARNGSEAFAAVERHQPALILLDVQMPDMDGYTVCKLLKSNPQTENIPIIFVTSMGAEGDETAGFAVGAVDYIVKPVSPPVVLARVRTHLSLVRAAQLERSYRDSIFMLGTAGHYNDTDTGVHIWRMAAYAKILAGAMGYGPHDCATMELAAPMHDTGKIGIPESILRKPGPLDSDEWAVMQSHTQIGYRILSQSDAPVFRLAAEIALYHHERWDGSGYPHKLAGTEIPRAAHIVALADVFDALTMVRPYKEAWPIDRAVSTIENSAGSHFDPEMIEVFLSILPRILEVKHLWDQREATGDDQDPSRKPNQKQGLR